MLSNRTVVGVTPILRHASRHASRQLPASSVALTRIISTYTSNRNSSSATSLKNTIPHCVQAASTSIRPVSVSFNPAMNRRWLSSHPHPICGSIDVNITKDLSAEKFDEAFKYIYAQHNHQHGPWLKTLHTAESVLKGIKNPKILVLGSGHEPSATLASNFPDGNVVSAHSTAKHLDWASAHLLDQSNASTLLVPSMEHLDIFDGGSFDLIVSIYMLENLQHPEKCLQEIHRCLKPGGSFVAAVWENLPADISADIILRRACVGQKEWHRDDDGRDVVQGYACPVRSKHPMSLGKPRLLENMLTEAKLPVAEVITDEYPLHLGSSKRMAFKALALPIQSELQVLKDTNHYHSDDAAEAFNDILEEGYMVKQHDDGSMEVPNNVYKYVVARREFEDGDSKYQPHKSGGSHHIKVSDIPK